MSVFNLCHRVTGAEADLCDSKLCVIRYNKVAGFFLCSIFVNNYNQLVELFDKNVMNIAVVTKIQKLNYSTAVIIVLYYHYKGKMVP